MAEDIAETDTEALNAFRAEVRSWIADNFPAALKNRPNPMSREALASPDADQ